MTRFVKPLMLSAGGISSDHVKIIDPDTATAGDVDVSSAFGPSFGGSAVGSVVVGPDGTAYQTVKVGDEFVVYRIQ